MSVIAKMNCSEKSKVDGGFKIVLWPVVGGSEENDQFYKYTPSGNCTLQTVNETAANMFEVGKEYYLTFSPA